MIFIFLPSNDLKLNATAVVKLHYGLLVPLGSHLAGKRNDAVVVIFAAVFSDEFIQHPLALVPINTAVFKLLLTANVAYTDFIELDGLIGLRETATAAALHCRFLRIH